MVWSLLVRRIAAITLTSLWCGLLGCGDPGPSDDPGPSRLVGNDVAAEAHTPQPDHDAGPSADDLGPPLDPGAPEPDVETPADAEPPLDTEPVDAVDPPSDEGPPTPDDDGPELPPVIDDPVPTRYVAGQIFSPIPAWVRNRILAIREAGPTLQDQVFMKVGASSTVSSNNLNCLANPAKIDLGDWPELQVTVDWYNEGDAAGGSPFARKTKAAKSGMSAGWVLSGNPSPLEQEIADIAPGSAMVHYGTNDMQLGITYESAIWKFGDNLLKLTDTLADQGVVPLMFAIMPRADFVAANWWVQTYNAVIRGVAQGRQVPFIDIHLAVAELPGFGLAGDGIHLNTASGGACIFTDPALEKGYNTRNLRALQLLERLRLIVSDLWEPDAATPLVGAGSQAEPFIIDSLPFSHLSDTSESPNSNIAFYPGCNAPQDESGPEYLYRLDLDGPTRLRMMVFDQGSVDVDLHLLDETATGEGCVERAHQIIQGTFGPGTWHVSLDTFVSQGDPKPGEYLFVVLECHPDDPDCD